MYEWAIASVCVGVTLLVGACGCMCGCWCGCVCLSVCVCGCRSMCGLYAGVGILVCVVSMCEYLSE